MNKKIIYYAGFAAYLIFGFVTFIIFKFTKNILRNEKAKENIIKIYQNSLPFFPKKPAPLLMPAKTVLLNFTSLFLGDNIVFSSFISGLKKYYPGVKIIVLTNPQTAYFIRRNPNVDKVICRRHGIRGFWGTLSELNSFNIDIVIDHQEINFKLGGHVLFFMFLKYKNLIAINKSEPFVTVSIPWNSPHITEMSRRIAAVLGFKMRKIPKYEIYLTKEERKKAAEIRADFKNKKLLIINPYTSSKMRDMSLLQIKKICGYLNKNHKNIQIAFIGHQHRLSGLPGLNAYIPRGFTLFDSLALLKTADLLISPDTGISHAGTAFSIPSFILFAGPQNPEQGRFSVWHPNNPKAVLLQGDGKEKLSDIPIEKIMSALKDFLKKYAC